MLLMPSALITGYGLNNREILLHFLTTADFFYPKLPDRLWAPPSLLLMDI